MSSQTSNEPSKIMRAWTHTSPTHPSKLTLSTTTPRPTLKSPTQVLIRITHAALNPGGLIMMQFCPGILRTKPCVPELDFSGTIVQIGEGVPSDRNLREGMEVFGSVTVSEHIKGAGALAEYVVINHETVMQLPKGSTLEDSAGLGVTGSTALALIDAANVTEGMNVLVNGVSGGVGTIVVQLVRSIVGTGKVVGTCSGKNTELAKSLGCDEVIDYETHSPIHNYLSSHYSASPFDIIIDAHGIQDIYLNCASFLKPQGSYISVGVAIKQFTWSGMFGALGGMMKNSLVPKVLGGTPRKYIQVSAVSNLKDMERLKAFVEQGVLKPVVDQVWAMEDVPKAYEVLINKRARGKIVIKIQD